MQSPSYADLMVLRTHRMNWILVVVNFNIIAAGFAPPPDIGYPAGLIPDCPGVMKNASISQSMMPLLQVVQLKYEGNQIVRKPMAVSAAARMLMKDKHFVADMRNKKIVIHAVGFLDSSLFPHSQAVGNVYLKRGYSVFISETFSFLTNIYPKSVRLSRVIGKKIGEFLVKLYNQGMQPENLELVGISLGAHIISYASKHFYSVTGRKPARITGLDPAGPCFRSLGPEMRLDVTDADRVDVLHTNIDGFGIAEPLGHVDFYANGGEFQPSDLPAIPCLVICSHIRSVLYWWQALEHPKKFLGVKCDTVQDARLANCYNNTVTNVLGLETKFNRPGIFYLPTGNEFPYYRGKEGLKPENEIYTATIREINKDSFVV